MSFTIFRTINRFFYCIRTCRLLFGKTSSPLKILDHGVRGLELKSEKRHVVEKKHFILVVVCSHSIHQKERWLVDREGTTCRFVLCVFFFSPYALYLFVL